MNVRGPGDVLLQSEQLKRERTKHRHAHGGVFARDVFFILEAQKFTFKSFTKKRQVKMVPYRFEPWCFNTLWRLSVAHMALDLSPNFGLTC